MVMITEVPHMSQDFLHITSSDGVKSTRTGLHFLTARYAVQHCVNEELERRVRERTRELEDANEALRRSARVLATELDAAQRLQHIATQLVNTDGIEALYEQILDTAMAILHSDFASIQMFFPERGRTGELRLLGSRGFSAEAARRWEWVRPATQTTCGEALRTRQRVAVPYVRDCDFMAGSDDLDGYLRAGIRAVQSTPLVSRSGVLLGMLSTHWREPHELTASELRALDVLARLAADLIERSRAEEELRESEERLRRAERLAHVGSWKWNIETNQVSWSDEEFQVFGQRRDYTPSYEGFFQAVIPRERERVARELRDALVSKCGFSSEVQILRPDGELRTIRFIAEMQLNEKGLPAGMFGATQDITDIKENEIRLLQSQEDLRALTARLVDLQESGMKELARELHDDLSQNLFALGMEISTMLPPSAKPSRSFSEGIRALHGRIMNLACDVHSISRRLHPAILDHLGLEAALRQECLGFSERTGIPTQFESEGVPEPLAKDVSLCFYRVAQESLHNIAKHACAANVRLALSGHGGTCTLRIEDDGQGFDPSAAKGKNALGLISIQERVRLVNGKFTIKSKPGRGTTLEVSVPQCRLRR
jgi:PAS domain S-box-containing protein